jgi:hypothetical protein
MQTTGFDDFGFIALNYLAQGVLQLLLLVILTFFVYRLMRAIVRIADRLDEFGVPGQAAPINQLDESRGRSK